MIIAVTDLKTLEIVCLCLLFSFYQVKKGYNILVYCLGSFADIAFNVNNVVTIAEWKEEKKTVW